MDDMIDVTGVDLVRLLKEAYALSRPQGLGILHARDGDLPDEDAQHIIARESERSHVAASMDYVHGRACKFAVFKKNGKLFIRRAWYDHSTRDLKTLLERCGFEHRIDEVCAWEAL